ncbi:hypothetical protein ILYODFUR_028087 [Ilyodon furcidens]|uniref:Uncharacterized protein n=1 Tax=Ilyodon furcidens TaxID=33524 RepID=A0ABV0TMB7_9TELE
MYSYLLPFVYLGSGRGGSTDKIHWSPNQTPSSHWLYLEILSMKVMNRTGDKGPPCHSPTCTGNSSDLMSTICTKLLLHLYLDQMPRNKGPQTPYSWNALTGHHKGHSQIPSPGSQSTCGPVGQTPMNPQAPCQRCRAGPLFHDRDENHTAPSETEV